MPFTSFAKRMKRFNYQLMTDILHNTIATTPKQSPELFDHISLRPLNWSGLCANSRVQTCLQSDLHPSTLTSIRSVPGDGSRGVTHQRALMLRMKVLFVQLAA